MLTKLVVQVYASIIEISLWFAVMLSGVVGYHYSIPLVRAAGWTPRDEATWKVLAAIASVSASFLVLAVLTGPFLVLLDIRKSMRNLETRFAAINIRHHAEHIEPSL
jgi:hypothetical protein